MQPRPRQNLTQIHLLKAGEDCFFASPGTGEQSIRVAAARLGRDNGAKYVCNVETANGIRGIRVFRLS